MNSSVIEQICQFWLSQITQKVLAWNFEEQMQNTFDVPISIAQLSPSAIVSFATRFPRFVLTLISTTRASATDVNTYGATQFKQLDAAVVNLVVSQPDLFMRIPEALDIFIRASLTDPKKDQLLKQCSFWKINNFLRLVKYLSFKFFQQDALNQLALKPLNYADPATVIFYLPQLFQSLRFDTSGRLKNFFKSKSRQSASFAHHLLWFCKVESANELQPGRKVPLPVAETLPKTA